MKPASILLLFFLIACKKDIALHPSDLNPYAFNLCDPDEPLECVGDSFTWGVLLPRYPDALASLLNKKVVMNVGIPGKTSSEILALYSGDSSRSDWPIIAWVGRNNVASREEQDVIISDIDKLVAGRKKYFVMEILTGNWQSEWIGTYYYNNNAELNDRLEQKHRRHFIRLKPYFQQFAINSFDSLCVKRGGIPQSLLVPGDSLHLNGLGDIKAAERVVMQLDQCENLN